MQEKTNKHIIGELFFLLNSASIKSFVVSFRTLDTFNRNLL